MNILGVQLHNTTRKTVTFKKFLKNPKSAHIFADYDRAMIVTVLAEPIRYTVQYGHNRGIHLCSSLYLGEIK